MKEMFQNLQSLIFDVGKLANVPLPVTVEQRSLISVIFRAFFAALTSGLGGLPIWLYGDLSDVAMGTSISFAAGLMGGCSVLMFVEALQWSALHQNESSSISTAFCSTVLGYLSVFSLARIFEGNKELTFVNLKGRNAARAIVVFLSMCIHSVGEGMSIASTAGVNNLGDFVMASLAVHNIPEGVAVSMVMVNKGMSVWHGSLCAILTNLPQPIVAIPAYIFLKAHQGILPLALGFSCGTMLFVIFNELIAEAQEKTSKFMVWLITCSVAGVVLVVFVYTSDGTECGLL